MNIINSKHCKNHKDGQGYKWYSSKEFYLTEGNYSSRWSLTLDLIPEPKMYSKEFLIKYGDEYSLIKNKLNTEVRFASEK